VVSLQDMQLSGGSSLLQKTVRRGMASSAAVLVPKATVMALI
jgi:hypothetical protein